METLRCPTCLSMLLVLDAGQQRCPMCRTRFGSRTQPVVLGENRANTATHFSVPARASGPEYAPSENHATTSVEVDQPKRHRRRRRATKTAGPSAAPICESLFEAAALVEPQPKTGTPFAPPTPTVVDIPEEAIRDMRTTVDAPDVFSTTPAVKPKVVPEPPVPAPVPAPVAAPVVPPAPAPVRIPPPIARVVAPPAVPVRPQPEPAPVDSIHALPPEPGTARARWWDRLPLRWTIAFVERPEDGPAACEPAPRPEPTAVGAPEAPAPPARARVAPAPVTDSPRPAPQPREPNPMWRDRVFRGGPDDVQHAPVTWPRRSDA